jgi:hypothetical protein
MIMASAFIKQPLQSPPSYHFHPVAVPKADRVSPLAPQYLLDAEVRLNSRISDFYYGPLTA